MVKVVVGSEVYYAKTWERTAGGVRLFTVASPQACRSVTIYTEEKIVIYEGIDAN